MEGIRSIKNTGCKLKIRRIIIGIIIILCVSIGAGVFYLTWMHIQKEEVADSVPDFQLPVFYMLVSGEKVNPMEGNLSEMADAAERSALTPVGTDRKIFFAMDPKDAPVESISYELHDLTDQSVVENGRIQKPKGTDGKASEEQNTETKAGDEKNEEKGTKENLESSLTLRNALKTGREYSLVFITDFEDGQQAYYYTRLAQTGNRNYGVFFAYAQQFAADCLDKGHMEGLSDELTVDQTKYRTSLQSLDIYSGADLVTWKDLHPVMVSSIRTRIIEANEVTCCLGLTYQVSARTEGGTDVIYDVKDFYRMRSNQERVILLDFYRHTEQEFDYNAPDAITEDGIFLGLQGEDVQVIADPSEKRTAFTANGNLWIYNREKNEISRILGSDGNVFEDKNYRIHLQAFDEDGGFTYFVYGYFPSGTHRGRSGISVCHYDAVTHEKTERLFVEIPVGIERLEKDLSRFLYFEPEKEQLYFYLNHGLYFARPGQDTVTSLVTELPPENLVVSASGERAAWSNGKAANDGSKITLMDLTDGKTREIKASGEGFIRALDFMGEDLVYGTGRTADIFTDALGNEAAGLSRIEIENMEGEELESYAREGLFITQIAKGEGSLELKLSKKQEEAYQEVSSDHIIKNALETSAVEIHEDASGNKSLAGAGNARTDNQAIKALKTKTSQRETKREVRLPWPETEDVEFFVYAKGELLQITPSAAEAVRLANTWNGTVLDPGQHYVWERGNWKATSKIAPESLGLDPKEVPLDIQKAEEALGKDRMVLNLTGNTREAMHYYVSRGWPVWASYGEDIICILGYDYYNIWIYDAGDEEDHLKAIGFDDAGEVLEASGNQFLTCIER